MEDETLRGVLSNELATLEREGEIVICSSSNVPIVKRLVQAALSVVPNTGLTDLEMIGIRRLLLHAISNKHFFDAEMPTLTGFSAAEFKIIAGKLPRD